MRRKWLIAVFCIIAVMILCVGCGKESEESTVTEEEKTTEATEEKLKNVTLFIGKQDDFGKYNWLVKENETVTPDLLIQAIADTTGWKLSLAKEVEENDDGYIVRFSKDSVFYTGQGTDENNEFYIPTEEDFYKTVLDSIVKTVSKYDKADAESTNFYFGGPGEDDLLLKGINTTLPVTTAYNGTLPQSHRSRILRGANTTSYDIDCVFLEMSGDETVKLEIDGEEQICSVTYTALKPIFQRSVKGRQMHVRITEDLDTEEKLIVKIYY
ncbi:MAG: hypothetical protein Q4D45_02095 [Lachnospiraceae bacterium]|nr:hypothetical protein [Lachnospiraceae bacterium]